MVRPAPTLAKFACLNCRTVMKREPLLPTDPAMRRDEAPAIEVRECPTCHADSYWVSSNFRAPPKDDRKAWDVVSTLVRAGLPYSKIWAPVSNDELERRGVPASGTLGASMAIGPWPTTMREATEFIERWGGLALPFRRPD